MLGIAYISMRCYHYSLSVIARGDDKGMTLSQTRGQRRTHEMTLTDGWVLRLVFGARHRSHPYIVVSACVDRCASNNMIAIDSMRPSWRRLVTHIVVLSPSACEGRLILTGVGESDLVRFIGIDPNAPLSALQHSSSQSFLESQKCHQSMYMLLIN